MTDAFTAPPDLADIEVMAREALTIIPDVLRERANDVVVQVEDFPSAEVERDMGLESPFDLLGLYQGVPFGERSVSDAPQALDMIFLYRRPLLDYWCETGEDLSFLVRHVLIHEIGHHFGFSDEDMERIEAEAEAEAEARG
jgi:predicted Zn-dependent protease with MMP-like domain